MVALGGFFVTLSPGPSPFCNGDEGAIQLFPFPSSLRAETCNKGNKRRLHPGYLSFGKYANLPWPSLALCTDLT